jgi:hypothetical protein
MAEDPHLQSPEESFPGLAQQPPKIVVAEAMEGLRERAPAAQDRIPVAEAFISPELQPPVRWREIVAVVGLILLADMTIYRGEGFAGYALWFVAAPLLLALGAPRPSRRLSSWLVGGMLVVLAAKLLWCGSGPLVAVGLALLAAQAMSLAGLTPYVLDVGAYVLQAPAAGCLGLALYRRSSGKLGYGVPRSGWLSVLLPLVAISVFGTIFVFANPDLTSSFGQNLRRIFESLQKWLVDFGPNWKEVLFWLAVGWMAVGLLRPVLRRSVLAHLARPAGDAPEPNAPMESTLYAALRNTLAAVVGLFAAYLVFEFLTLWFREFPKGFYYAGYAHEGAAWLTVALALATVVLSLVFRGRVLHDPRLPRLRRLAWIWSAQNMLLALAVYHRLFIYIDFNGMTRMRTVGLVGMTAVVVGFVLVIWKIARQRDFVWLIQRHLWTLVIAVYVLAVLPVDTLVHHYNVRRVLAGDLAPSVQISVHPINSEGVLVLHPLTQSSDPIIREGILAMLAQRAEELEAVARERQQQGWTSYQWADQALLEQLRSIREDWQAYSDRHRRSEALAKFREYAYQWY